MHAKRDRRKLLIISASVVLVWMAWGLLVWSFDLVTMAAPLLPAELRAWDF
jgi:hypothetical protein